MTSPDRLHPDEDARPNELRRRVAGLIVVRASGHLSDGQRGYPRWELDNARLQRLLRDGVGGVILLGGTAVEVAQRIHQLSAWASTPLLLCADVEEGVGQRFSGASWFIPPLAIGRLHREDRSGALSLAERYGRCTGREARQLGLNWVLAPVCDVNNNAANPVINVRAWGEEPGTAGDLAAAFIRGAQAEGVICCAKHFPGHGDTSSDSHLELPVLPHSRERLEAIELPPFRRAISEGVASVMTAHLMLPALDSDHPSTLSPTVLTSLLRHDLGFGGLIVTDALVMEAISGRYGAGEAAVLALEAGADLVLMPADADLAIEAVMAAVESGRLTRADIDARLARRRHALERIPPNRSGERPAQAPLGGLSNGPLPADRELALELVERNLQLHNTIPVTPGAGPSAGSAGMGINLIRVDSILSCPFLSPGSPALAAPATAGFRPCLIDRHSPSPWADGGTSAHAPLALERLGDGPVLLQLFVRGNPFRGEAGGGQEPWLEVIRQLQAIHRLAGVAVYGSPYLWETLQPVLARDIPAGWSAGQMPIAQAALLRRLGLRSAGDLEAQPDHADTDGAQFTD